jgi:hypothetical protein
MSYSWLVFVGESTVFHAGVAAGLLLACGVDVGVGVGVALPPVPVPEQPETNSAAITTAVNTIFFHPIFKIKHPVLPYRPSYWPLPQLRQPDTSLLVRCPAIKIMLV